MALARAPVAKPAFGVAKATASKPATAVRLAALPRPVEAIVENAGKMAAVLASTALVAGVRRG